MGPGLAQERAGVALLRPVLDTLRDRPRVGISLAILIEGRWVVSPRDEDALLGEPDRSLTLEAGAERS